MEDEEYIDDDMNLDLDDELEDDEISIGENENLDDIDEEYVYKKLEERRSPHAHKIIGNSIHDEIVANESGGDYKAENPHSSAVGKYQFLWNTWGGKIKQVTGVSTKEEFKNSPHAQEDFYNNYYVPNEMMPAVKGLRKYAPGMSDKQLAKLYHYQGEGRAKAYLTGQLPDRVESYNAPISKYIGKRQLGGMGIKPLKTNFKTPDITMDYLDSHFDRTTPSDAGSDFDLDGIATGIQGVYNTAKQYAGKVADGLSEGIDLVENFTSEQNKNEQYRKMLQRLNGDNPSNYSPSTQRVNNNPII